MKCSPRRWRRTWLHFPFPVECGCPENKSFNPYRLVLSKFCNRQHAPALEKPPQNGQRSWTSFRPTSSSDEQQTIAAGNTILMPVSRFDFYAGMAKAKLPKKPHDRVENEWIEWSFDNLSFYGRARNDADSEFSKQNWSKLAEQQQRAWHWRIVQRLCCAQLHVHESFHAQKE